MSSARPVNAGSLERVLPDIEPSHPGSSVDLARLPAAAAAAAGPPSLAGRVAAAQSPQERILAELRRESDFTPLGLCLLQFRDLDHPAERLQRVSDWMRDLHSKTTQRKNKSTAPLTLRELRQLQEEIMNANLKRVGKLWGRSCHCFVSADQVRGWLRLYPEEFQVKLDSPYFCASLGELCTFIPPEVAQLVRTDEAWGRIAGGTFSWLTGRVNEALFQGIATWRSQSISGEIVARCFATFALHLQSVQSPFLLYFCSLLQERPIDSISFLQWDTVGETMVSLIVKKRLHIPAFIELFSARREAFRRNWGEFAVRACSAYSHSRTDENRAYLAQLVRVFFSDPDRISAQQLVEGFSALALSLRESDEPLLLLFISIFERQRPDFFTPAQWKSIGETALALIADRQLQIPDLIEFFSARKEAFYPHWGEFAVRVCASYSHSRTDENRAYLAQLVRVFFSDPDRISAQQLVEGFSALALSLRESDEPLLLLFISIFERQRPDFFTSAQWKSIGETALALAAGSVRQHYQGKNKSYQVTASLSRRGAEAVARLFSHQKRVFYPHWEAFAEQTCKLHSNSPSQEVRAYYEGMVRFFLSEPERLSVEKLIACCTTLILHSQHVDESVLQRCVEVLARIPLTQALEMQLAAMVIERIKLGGRDRTVPRLLGLRISDQALLSCVNNKFPIQAQFCIHSLYSQRPILDARMGILRALNQYRPGHFEHDLAVHQASLAAWNEGWAERAPTPPPANDSTTGSQCCASG